MLRSQMFTYAWHIDESETEYTAMRVYGLNKKNENVCVQINDFTPYIYLELPPNVDWTEGMASMVGRKIDDMMGQKRPLKKCLIQRYKLYYAHLNKKGERKKFPYLFCSFSHSSEIRLLSFKLKKPISIPGVLPFMLRMHEHNASPVLQFTSQRKIPTAGWIEFHGKKVDKHEKRTRCKHEYIVKWDRTQPIDEITPGKPLIMGFDIEVNSSNPARMPCATKPADKVFQISCILSRQGDPPEKYNKYLLSLGNPDSKIVGEDVNILKFDHEDELLTGFTDFINKHNPNVLVGYNILGFDIPYMIDRAKECCILRDFDKMGFLKDVSAKEMTISWSSSAYKNQSFQFLDAEGRLFVDLLPLVKRDYKFDNYKLKTIALKFLNGITKDDLSPQGIFKCYKIGMRGGPKGDKAMGVVGKYCMKDGLLMNLLFEKLQTWIGLAEMATVCNVPIFYLYTKGQQIKVFSQLYKKCTHDNITVEKDGYVPKEDEHYVGATVFPPVPGVYDRVVPFDFASLYPSTIIAYNLDFSTLVEDKNIPDEKCHVMTWFDHIFCEHDPKVIRKAEITNMIKEADNELKKLRASKVGKRGAELEELKMTIKNKLESLKPYREERSELNKSKPKHPMCCARRFRWLKEPLGVLPTLLKDLLDARAHTRKEMKNVKAKLSNKNLTEDEKASLNLALTVLDKRQLAYKISANSGYGATGVQRGFLPMMPVAMCTTYMGRISIQKVADVIPRKFKGQLVYGDTDSNYIAFPHLADKTAKDIWEYSVYVANEVSKLFPPPMRLEFEDVIYWRFFILTKKRYMSLACGEDGVVSDEIKKKGVLLARRDNCEFIRSIYGDVILKIFHREPRDDIINFILDELNKMCSSQYEYTKFVMTQAIGEYSATYVGGKLQNPPFIDAKGKTKVMLGDYKVPILPTNPKDREKQMKLKKATSEEEYYVRCIPAQVQLGEKMKRRGQRVEAGTRLEYVVTTNGGRTAKKYEKIESSEYYKKYSRILDLDFMYYLHQLTNHMDQVLNIVYAKNDPSEKYQFKKNFVLNQYKYRLHRDKLLEKIRSLTTKFVFAK